MLALLALVVLAQTQSASTASPSPAPSTPSPTPSATPVALVTVVPEFAVYDLRTNPSGGNSADVSDGLLNIAINAGKLHATATAGAYSFPVVGFPLAADTEPGANVDLYSPLPLAALTYQADANFSVSAGKFASLLGQESPFTYQNLNIQRGLGWNMEPAITRGVQIAYANGPWSVTARDDDGYYSGTHRAVEWLFSWSPSANTSLQFAGIAPDVNTPPNPTASIANKGEFDFMYTRTIGKLQLLPYFLTVRSPASAALGYPHDETASAAVLLAAWNFSTQWSTAFRYESARNASASNDTSPNADLVGFGPGSSAISETETLAYRFGNAGILRVEYSNVNATGLTQNRFGFELGVMR